MRFDFLFVRLFGVFADITNQQLNKIMDDKDGLNTKRSTKQAVRLFRKYLLEKEVDTDF
jgi:hypothetical protein